MLLTHYLYNNRHGCRKDGKELQLEIIKYSTFLWLKLLSAFKGLNNKGSPPGSLMQHTQLTFPRESSTTDLVQILSVCACVDI